MKEPLPTHGKFSLHIKTSTKPRRHKISQTQTFCTKYHLTPLGLERDLIRTKLDLKQIKFMFKLGVNHEYSQAPPVVPEPQYEKLLNTSQGIFSIPENHKTRCEKRTKPGLHQSRSKQGPRPNEAKPRNIPMCTSRLLLLKANFPHQTTTD